VLTAAAGQPLAFRRISTGEIHACGVTTDDRAYCWGFNYFGQLGSGSFGAAEGPIPVPAIPQRRFQEVRAGLQFTCGLDLENRIFCWGLNDSGQLGDGTNRSSSLTAVPVAGGRRYRALRTGASHACAITTTGVTYCWGLNADGQLGDGTTTNRRAPVKVSGGMKFRTVSTGDFHTCGLDQSDKAFCWGRNSNGQLGNRSSTRRLIPAGVSDGLTFATLSAGGAHTCAVTPQHKAYCWGWNKYGQLGDGTFSRRSRPTLVAGGLAFSGVSPGRAHTCGVTTGNVAYCWGWNFYGQVGDGTAGYPAPVNRPNPTAVSGGLRFDRVLASLNAFTCGITTDDRGYCWGQNLGGYLGDGTLTNRSSPSPIVGPE
jgi:alpha-tubulin suppressor-like RCC1 family protein